jgi:hypothetical protein
MSASITYKRHLKNLQPMYLTEIGQITEESLTMQTFRHTTNWHKSKTNGFYITIQQEFLKMAKEARHIADWRVPLIKRPSSWTF